MAGGRWEHASHIVPVLPESNLSHQPCSNPSLNFSVKTLSLSLCIYIILFSFSLTISVSWSSLSFFTLFSMAASAIGLATSLLPSTSGKSTTAFSSAAFPSDRASVSYKGFKIRGPKCQAVFPSEKIDSRALTASPLELLKSSPANSKPHF